jgi:hypothetical protein
MHPWNEVFSRHQTDKSMHNYGHIYSYLLGRLQLDPLSILEIGVWEGGSLRAWEELFPYATIVGVDKDFERRKYATDRSVVEIANASDEEKMNRIADSHGPFDVVIDDGSHRPNDVRAAFHVLWPHLAFGGVYIIEDLDVAWNPEYQQGSPIITEHVERLRMETRSTGVQDKITIVAGELIAFVKINNAK